MKKYFVFLIVYILSAGYVYSQPNFNQTVFLNTEFTGDTTFSPFNGGQVTSIGVSGSIVLNSDTSFIRVIINDGSGNEYLVYEMYRMLANDSVFDFYNECEESCFYENFTPVNFIIQVKDASLFIDAINLSNTVYSNPENLRTSSILNKNHQKLAAVQNYIQENNLIWVAEETEFSKLSYTNKAKVWGSDYASFGYEYYTKGIYSISGPKSNATMNHDYVGNFDWRNRHNANLNTSPYFDGDVNGTGWMTPVVCQGLGCWLGGTFLCNVSEYDCNNMGGSYRTAGTCWAFGPTAYIEALTNLYYNEHVDVDLSEQYIACKENTIDPWLTFRAFEYYAGSGVPDEGCLVYSASLDYCDDECITPSERIGIAGYTQYYSNSHQDVRQYLMENGPVEASFMSMPWGLQSHSISLVGWGVIDEDELVPIGVTNPITSDWYGCTYWIYKENYGPGVYNDGFKYMIHYNGIQPHITTATLPITSLNRTDADINCYDKDGDGYYYWGIGPKPSHCPPCPNEEDGDDSNPGLGPLNADGTCTIINAYNASFEEDWDNWVQVGTDDQDWWRHSGPTPTHINESGLTGPSGAQDGNFYIYTEGSCNGCFSYKEFVIVSPLIELSSYCQAQIDFYYHQHTFLWGNPDLSKLTLQVSYDEGATWSDLWYVLDDQGAQWHNEKIALPKGVNKVRFIARTGGSEYSDIAIDNITIEPLEFSTTPYIINSTNIVWNTDATINRDVIIETGADLTINNSCIISMHESAKIIVKTGAKLVVDGATLTSTCELWQGIEVQGKSDQSQYTPDAQGQIILKNGAVIENARTGIIIIANGDDPHNYDFTTTGGIIKANGSTFRNCITGIHFLDYTNTHPTTGAEIPNVSYIKNCTFETTENIAGGGYPDAFIKMENVQWVKILGNTFQNTNPLADPDYLGEGINSIDAKYKVSSFCSNFTNPCTSEVKNQFINLRYGVRATATQSTYPVTVEDAVFDKCHFGVYLGKVGFATVINNEFIVSDWFDPTSKKNKYAYGLYLAQSNDYRVEGNYFHSVSPRGWTGIYISNGNLTNNTAADEIYRNTFDNLYSAIVALNDNDGPDPHDGLTFHCNWFTNNTYDISVMPWTDTRTSVGAIQGTGFPSLLDPTLLVRNYYSADCIGNENRFLIDWNPQTPQDIQHTSYNGANWLPPSGCADYYVKMYGSPYVYNPSHCQDRTVVDPFIIEMELEQLARQKSELNEIIDGGQTALLVSIAQSALPKGQILQSMMEFSPYLSDEVLLALIERPNALPPGTMQQILSANSPLSEKVFTAVQEMTPALPNGILNQIANLQTGELSDRDFIPLVEASYTQKQSLLISDLVRYYLNDTLTYNPIDSVIKILSDVQYKDAKINLVSVYIEAKNFNKAQSLLDSLVIIEPELNAFADKQELSIMKANQPGGVYSMLNDSVAIQILNTISTDTTKFGSLYAMNIIEAIGDSIYEELTLIPTPDMNNRNMLENSPASNSKNNAYLNCYPNPATEKINIEYSLYNDAESKFILMYNVKGQEIYREDLLDIEGVTTITVPETEGTYYIYIEADGAILAIDKIVVL